MEVLQEVVVCQVVKECQISVNSKEVVVKAHHPDPAVQLLMKLIERVYHN
jgi:hypothetical protein